jgi:hypothetical protein
MSQDFVNRNYRSWKDLLQTNNFLQITKVLMKDIYMNEAQKLQFKQEKHLTRLLKNTKSMNICFSRKLAVQNKMKSNSS